MEILAHQPDAIMDYGSLIYVTLQRSKTAREAIQTMVSLMDQYGYYSEGESFSISDSTSGEVWMMEVIGRGDTYGKLGAVWVARRIPPGAVAAHANQARITTFPRNDPDNCLYADDVVDVAIHYGLFAADADPATFSFSDVYAPLNFMSARSGEARVWSIFSALADHEGIFQDKYLSYATGRHLAHRMPLWIEPYKNLTLADITNVMTSHYEGTELDPSKDVGAGLYGAPQRPRPLEWSYKGKQYHNERTIALSKTGWNFVAQMRPWMPPELGAMQWFGVDDSSTSPRFPVYGSSRQLSQAYYGKGPQDGVKSPILDFDLTKAFWVQNMVSNFAYFRWSDVYPIVRSKIEIVQAEFMDDVVSCDRGALALYKNKGPAAAVAFVSDFGVNAGDSLHAEWLKFYGKLFVRFRDFYEIVPNEDKPDCGCEVKETGMTDEWKQRIVHETGNHYHVADHKNGLRNENVVERAVIY